METVDSIVKFLKKGQWLASLDLQDAYMHVPVLPAHRAYLRFAFQNVHYQFKVLPFGLMTAPRVFTKVLSQVPKNEPIGGISCFDFFLYFRFSSFSHSFISRAFLPECIFVYLLSSGLWLPYLFLFMFVFIILSNLILLHLPFNFMWYKVRWFILPVWLKKLASFITLIKG